MGKHLFLILSLSFVIACQRVIVRDTLGGDTTAILGGENASTKEFPFIVNIWQNSPKDSYHDHLCGGSLIAKKWVLTAAHCMLEDTSEQETAVVKTSELTLYMNSDLRSGQGGRELKVKKIYVHPDFSWPKHDVALIELAEEVTNVVPVTLNSVKDLGAAKSAIVATVAGWGIVDARGVTESTSLQKVQVPLISREVCNSDWFPKKRGWDIGPEILCASSTQDSRSACPGDSGGPLVMNRNGVTTQIGIVSWGNACRGTDPAHPSNVEGYSDVADALPWIQRTLSK